MSGGIPESSHLCSFIPHIHITGECLMETQTLIFLLKIIFLIPMVRIVMLIWKTVRIQTNLETVSWNG